MTNKLKKYLVLVFAGCLYYSGIMRLWIWIRHRRRQGNDICVLGLHRVLNSEESLHANSLPGILFRQSTFEAVLEHLSRHYLAIPLAVFLLKERFPSPSHKLPCLLTFDDGWRDNYTTALPILRKYNLPATIFAVTGLIGTSMTFWVEQLGRIWKDSGRRAALIAAVTGAANGAEPAFEAMVENLKHLPSARREQVLASVLASSNSPDDEARGDRMLTWDEARALQEAGVEIEAHSVTHPLLVYEDDETVGRELSQSKQTLEEKLGKRVRAFAYPNGTWDERVRKMVEEAGYECAFVTEKGWHRRGADRFTIRRIMLHEGMVTAPNGKFSPALLSLRLSGLI
jgi:peptidoglycan/xylan/chitin deacetylase (PgdA/CDA1 family)